MIIHKNKWYWGETHTIIVRSGVGFVNISIHNDIPGVATIHGISVIEDRRKIGIGSDLLFRAENEAKQMGATRIEICAETGSWVEKWYKKCGYIETGKCEDWNGSVLMKNLI